MERRSAELGRRNKPPTGGAEATNRRPADRPIPDTCAEDIERRSGTRDDGPRAIASHDHAEVDDVSNAATNQDRSERPRSRITGTDFAFRPARHRQDGSERALPATQRES